MKQQVVLEMCDKVHDLIAAVVRLDDGYHAARESLMDAGDKLVTTLEAASSVEGAAICRMFRDLQKLQKLVKEAEGRAQPKAVWICSQGERYEGGVVTSVHETRVDAVLAIEEYLEKSKGWGQSFEQTVDEDDMAVWVSGVDMLSCKKHLIGEK